MERQVSERQVSYPVINLPLTGRSIEEHRLAAGLSVRDLQSYFGFEYPQAIYKWQQGKSLPSVDNLLALARLLQVSMEDLLVCDDQGASFFMAGAPNGRCHLAVTGTSAKHFSFWICG